MLQVARQFADMHDTPVRTPAVGAVQGRGAWSSG
jgi:hypothetical protein